TLLVLVLLILLVLLPTVLTLLDQLIEAGKDVALHLLRAFTHVVLAEPLFGCAHVLADAVKHFLLVDFRGRRHIRLFVPFGFFRRPRRLGRFFRLLRLRGRLVLLDRRIVGRSRLLLDRKSTRLNSSHVAISYAV